MTPRLVAVAGLAAMSVLAVSALMFILASLTPPCAWWRGSLAYAVSVRMAGEDCPAGQARGER